MKDSKPDSQFEDKEWTFVIEDVSYFMESFVVPLTGPVYFRAQIISYLLKFIILHACTGGEVVLYQALYLVDYLKAEPRTSTQVINFKENYK